MNKEVEEKSRLIPLIKLIIWIVVFIAILLIVKYQDMYNNTSKEDNVLIKVQEISFEDKLNDLNNNYKYTYKIIINNKEYVFVGEKMVDSNNNITEHFTKTINDITTEYFIKYNYIYEVKNSELIKTSINKVFDSINKDYLDIEKIKELINNKEFTIDNNNNYIYNIDNIQISINEDIDSINIIDDKNEYNIYLNDINKVISVTY